MLLWKEWRETRFNFGIALFFLTGMVVSLPAERHLSDEFLLNAFVVLFCAGVALVLGCGAVAPEIESHTIPLLAARPKGRSTILATKYLVRGVEVLLIYSVPMLYKIIDGWDTRIPWMWWPPYPVVKYLLFSVAVVMFAYSGAFLFSALFRKQLMCALGSLVLVVSYFTLRGLSLRHKIYRVEMMETDIWLLALLCVAAFVASVLVFRAKDL
jgi:ABC-type transport system involved in multi-copper enzyme maturation permease subunit